MDPILNALPDFRTAALVAALGLAWVLPCAALAAWLRVRRGVRTPYTRKVFHFLTIAAATLVQLRWGFGGVMVYGSVVTLVVLYTVARGEGFPFYEAIARDTDAPHRTRFILIPLATTAVGGLLANLLFPLAAHVGYMAVAVGDAVGEPVGTRWGRHRYTVPSLSRRVPATRSLEGSAAVFVSTALAVGLLLLMGGEPFARAAGIAAAVAAATAAVEAASHHGLDNLTIQVAASAVAALLL
ncbi:MAG TPA: hypothetical protein VK939_07075 [Longimicrobiales bacterium]|nr:hypothetical protein [Longimicrobiales bacterium]